ncbi:hypothetical protein SAMN04488023_16110 [Pedobacter rhizosphaerae]|uniref:Uncharacterized protein n=1 Tax=Pedobacter rhizosphaerae TaxID=390241 RepID=A0A1H9W8R8_9SPHI|nr:hypothetical protein SAMN04488023_16110 [Pedobacter rhizosphaerae]
MNYPGRDFNPSLKPGKKIKNVGGMYYGEMFSYENG